MQKGYDISGRAMFQRQVSSKVIGDMVRVSTGQRGTDRTHLRKQRVVNLTGKQRWLPTNLVLQMLSGFLYQDAETETIILQSWQKLGDDKYGKYLLKIFAVPLLYF